MDQEIISDAEVLELNAYWVNDERLKVILDEWALSATLKMLLRELLIRRAKDKTTALNYLTHQTPLLKW